EHRRGPGAGRVCHGRSEGPLALAAQHTDGVAVVVGGGQIELTVAVDVSDVDIEGRDAGGRRDLGREPALAIVEEYADVVGGGGVGGGGVGAAVAVKVGDGDVARRGLVGLAVGAREGAVAQVEQRYHVARAVAGQHVGVAVAVDVGHGHCTAAGAHVVID